MFRKLLTLHMKSVDTDPDGVDDVIAGAFGAKSDRIACGELFHYLDLEREANIVRHTETLREVVITDLAELLQPHCAFPQVSLLQQDPVTGEVQEVEGRV